MRSRQPIQVSSSVPPALLLCCVAALLCSALIVPAAAAGTETRISFGEGSQDDPRISGDWIVWVEKNTDYDIVLYDIASGTPTVFNGGTLQNYPRIDGEYAVWEGDRYQEGSQSHNYDIYLLHIPTRSVTRLNNDQWDFQYYPDISGDGVVWVDDRNRFPTSQWDIYLYRISSQTETRITTDTWDQSRPAIDGNYVVMEDYRDGGANLSLFDISTGQLTPLVTAASSQLKPRIDGNYVVYQDYRNGHSEIYLMDLSTRQETRITSHASGSYTPDIDGDRIVWTDDRNGNDDIYLYNITSGIETRITTDPNAQTAPDISGNRIVWMDNRHGDHNVFAVYLYTMDPAPDPTPIPTPDPDPDGDGDPTPPIAEFTSDVQTGTPPLTVHFTDQSTGTGPFTYSWDFQNDGSEDSTLKDPMYIYNSAGTFTVKLTVTGPGGMNSETKNAYITVNPAPTLPDAEFTADVQTGTAPMTVHFTDQSTGTGPFTYSWDFQNDGSEDSTLKDPTFIYTSAGTFTVKLTVTGPGGTNTETKNAYITVNPAPETLVMTTSTASTNTYLGYSSTYLRQAQSFRAADTGISRIAVALARRGTPAMEITLSVRTVLKGTDLSTATILPSQVTSTDYKAPTWVEVPLDLRGQLTKGQTCYVVLSVPTYSSRNCYLVPLNGNNPFKEGYLYKNTVLSQTASSEMLMKVWFTDGMASPILPDAEFMADVRTGEVPLTVHFTDQSTGTGPLTYSWDFQNDGSEDSTLKDPTYIYTSAGTYTVKLTVTGPGGMNSETKNAYITVNPAPTLPDAEFTADVQTGTAPLTVHFTDLSTGTGPFTYSWDFQNDGSGDSTLKDPTYIYTSAGTYTVKLTVTGQGGTNTETKNAYITVNPAPTPTPAPGPQVTTTETTTTSTYLGYSSSYVKQAQSLKAAGTGISRVAIGLARKGTPTRNITVRVRTTLNGADLATATITPAMVTSTDSASPSWVEVPIEKESILTTGSTLYVVLDTGTYDLKNYYYVPLNSGNPYADGIHYRGTTFYPNSVSDMLVKAWFTA